MAAQEGDQRRPQQVGVFTARAREVVCGEERKARDRREREELGGRFLLDGLEGEGGAGRAREGGQGGERDATEVVGDALGWMRC